MGCARHNRTGGPSLMGSLRRRARTRLVAVTLLALALRSLIPLGFMPAADGSLSLMICPAGFPRALLPEPQRMPDGMGMPGSQPGHPGHGVMDEGYCIFTTGFSAAPPPLLLVTLLLLLATRAVVAVRRSRPSGPRLLYLPQARAPPATA
jgi:Protein of unknown function (DUF2946)